MAHTVGALDEGYFLYLEETEWQRRIARAGWRRDLVADARFLHEGGGSSEGYPLASVHYLRSIRRYFGGRGTAVVAVAALLGEVAMGRRAGPRAARPPLPA